MNAISTNGTCFMSTSLMAKHVRSFVELLKRLELLPHRWSRPIDEKKLDFKQHSYEVGTGMNATDQVQSRET